MDRILLLSKRSGRVLSRFAALPVATAVVQEISDATVITLVLPMFERTGLFLHSVNVWNGLELADQTFDCFKSHLHVRTNYVSQHSYQLIYTLLTPTLLLAHTQVCYNKSNICHASTST